MALYKFGERTVSSDAPTFQKELENVHTASAEQKPRCLCRHGEPGHDEGIAMVVAKIGGRFTVKRWPNSAEKHAANCGFSELPMEMTPYGALQRGEAVLTLSSGHIRLRLDFSLAEGGEREKPGGNIDGGEHHEPEQGEGDSNTKKLTIRAALHYLWHEADLDKWDRGCAGIRDWAMISGSLRMAANEKHTGSGPLGQLLFVPEVLGMETELPGIAGARAKIASRKKIDDKLTPLLLLIAEYKDIKHYDQYSHTFTTEDVPEYPFLMEDENEHPWSYFSKNFRMAADIFSTTFKDELDLLREHKNCHLITIATFSFSDRLVALKKAAVMLVNENWLPFQNVNEKRIIDELTAKNRLFDIVLRFNQHINSTRPFIILKDAAPRPTALYIVPERPKEDYKEEREKQAELGNYAVWEWNPSIDADYPPLPMSQE